MRLLFAAALFLALPAAASAAPEQAPERHCFASSSWQNWSVSDDGNVLYLRAGRDLFRVELTPGSRVRRTPGDFLITEVRGSPWICSALDLDLTIADTNGSRRPLIAHSLRKLTPEEVAAIPADQLPN
jgi:hypothetical protein